MHWDVSDMQKKAIEFISEHKRCVLMVERPEDKVYITLSAVQELIFNRFLVRKVLILTSKYSAEHIWLQAKNKYNDIVMLENSLVLGSKKQKIRALCKKADYYIMNYDAISISNLKRLFDFDMLVIDELNEFRNFRTKKYQSLLLFCSKINRILGITRELTTHSLNDMWAEFYILDGGERLEKTYDQFCEKYFFKVITNKGKGYIYEPKNCALEEIAKSISDISYLYKLNANERKGKRQSVYYAHLNSIEMTRYLWMKKESEIMLDKNKLISASGIVDLSTKLFQMANGAVYNNEHEIIILHDRKLDALKEIVKMYTDRNILIAYWFLHDAERIVSVFKNAKILESESDINEWNAGKYTIALIHPALKPEIGLFGGGNTLIWFSLTWSLHLYNNVNERIVEGNKDNNGTIIHIVAADTIDEKIYQTLSKKETNQQELINTMIKENANE